VRFAANLTRVEDLIYVIKLAVNGAPCWHTLCASTEQPAEIASAKYIFRIEQEK